MRRLKEENGVIKIQPRQAKAFIGWSHDGVKIQLEYPIHETTM